MVSLWREVLPGVWEWAVDAPLNGELAASFPVKPGGTYTAFYQGDANYPPQFMGGCTEGTRETPPDGTPTFTVEPDHKRWDYFGFELTEAAVDEEDPDPPGQPVDNVEGSDESDSSDASRAAPDAKQKSRQSLASVIAAYRAELASARSGYVASDVQIFESMLDKAAEIAASPDATQEVCDSMVATLQSLHSMLRPVANKTTLSVTISKAGAVVTKHYTKKSIPPFTLALSNARAVNGNPNLGQDEQPIVNAANAQLKAAMNSLVYNVTKMTVAKSVKNKLKKLKKGKTFRLKVSVAPKAIQKQVKLKYKTSNKKVATVSKTGKIKAIRKGKATVTVAAPNGRTLKVKVTVK
jgi:hypothetical protein